MNTPHISLTTSAPVHDQRTREFRQAVTFKSPLPLAAEQIEAIVSAGAELFRQAMRLNELHDHEWPPHIISVDAQNDRKGGVIVFGARADRRRPIILHA